MPAVTQVSVVPSAPNQTIPKVSAPQKTIVTIAASFHATSNQYQYSISQYSIFNNIIFAASE
jgi:hypothetical protein